MIEAIKALIEAIKVFLGAIIIFVYGIAILYGIFFIITNFIEERHKAIKRK